MDLVSGETHTPLIRHGDIVDLVSQVKAKMVIPIHTFEPERFQTFSPNAKILADGEMMRT